jgi:hypothetical protein
LCCSAGYFGVDGAIAAVIPEQLATHITDLQTKPKIEQTEQGRIALVGCETDKPSSSGTAAEITSLAQSVAKRLYDSGNGTINAEVTESMKGVR